MKTINIIVYIISAIGLLMVIGCAPAFTETKIIGRAGCNDFNPAWSPGGTNIAFLSEPRSGEPLQIYLWRPEGKNGTIHSITRYEDFPDGFELQQIQWHPQNNTLLAVYNNDLWMLDTESHQGIQLTRAAELVPGKIGIDPDMKSVYCPMLPAALLPDMQSRTNSTVIPYLSLITPAIGVSTTFFNEPVIDYSIDNATSVIFAALQQSSGETRLYEYQPQKPIYSIAPYLKGWRIESVHLVPNNDQWFVSVSSNDCLGVAFVDRETGFLNFMKDTNDERLPARAGAWTVNGYLCLTVEEHEQTTAALYGPFKNLQKPGKAKLQYLNTGIPVSGTVPVPSPTAKKLCIQTVSQRTNNTAISADRDFTIITFR